MLNTIQINKEEDKLITKAKKDFSFSSKKAVLLAGIEALYTLKNKDLKKLQMQQASLAVRKESMRINKEMAPLAYIVLNDDKW